MSRELFNSGAVVVTAYVGPQRDDGGARMRLQIDTTQNQWPRNTLSFEEARQLYRELGKFVGEGLRRSTGHDIDTPGFIDLGHQMFCNVTESPDEVEANITRAPDAHTPDVMLMKATGETVGECRHLLAVQLRAMAKRLDGVPTVTSVEVRNEPVAWESQTGPAMVSESLDRLKVLVELEDEPRVSRIVFEQAVEPMNQTINYGANAYHFGSRRIDPVSERWRKEREGESLPFQPDEIDRRYP